MKIRVFLLTVLCVTSYVKGLEHDDRLPFQKDPKARAIDMSVIRDSVVEQPRYWWDKLPWPCATLCRCFCCCCKRPDMIIDDAIVSPEQFQQMRQTKQVNTITPPPLPPSALPTPDDPGKDENRDNLDI